MDEKQEFSDRLRAAMQARKLEASAVVLERAFNLAWPGQRGISRQTAWKWLSGQAIPTQDKLQVLAQWLKVAPDQLRFGTQVVARLRDEERRFDEALSYSERDTLHAFLKLAPAQRRLIRELILELAKAAPA